MYNAKVLLRDIDRLFMAWNEKSMFSIKGVKNLSVSDLETLQLYAEELLRTGNLNSFMPPMGGIKTVLEKYELI